MTHRTSGEHIEERRPDSPLRRFFEDFDDHDLTELIDEAMRERMVRAHWRSHGEEAA
jgi:hypothetical protein